MGKKRADEAEDDDEEANNEGASAPAKKKRKSDEQEIPWYEVDLALDNDEAEPTEHSVTVSNLSYETKRAAVRKAAKRFGTVVSVRRFVREAPRHAHVSFSTSAEMA